MEPLPPSYLLSSKQGLQWVGISAVTHYTFLLHRGIPSGDLAVTFQPLCLNSLNEVGLIPSLGGPFRVRWLWLISLSATLLQYLHSTCLSIIYLHPSASLAILQACQEPGR